MSEQATEAAPVGAPAAERAPLRTWLKIVALAAIFAVPSGLAAAVFIALMRFTTDLAWTTVPDALGLPRPVVLFGVPVLGAIAVGLIVRYAPGHGGPEPSQEHGLGGHTGTMRELPGTAGAAIVSLASGASLGPEAPLVGILGTLGGATSRRLALPPEIGRLLGVAGLSAVLGAIFGNPLAVALLLLELSPVVGRELYQRIVPSLVASTMGVFIMDAVAGGAYFHLEFPAYAGLEWWHLGAAVAIGIGGGLVGLAYAELTRGVRRLLAPLAERVMLRLLIGALVVGAVAVVFGELTLFSGEHEINTVIAEGESMGLATLLLLALGKTIAGSVSISAGFRGGRIFPILFVGGTLGMALHVAIPAVPAALAVSCGMASTGISLFRYPLFLVALLVLFTSADMVPVMLIAAITGWVIAETRPEL